MKSFKQHNESHTVALNSAEDDNLGLFNVQDERVMQRLNGFVGAIAQQEYMQPDAAMKQLEDKDAPMPRDKEQALEIATS